MTEKRKSLRIFISSPGDVVEERTLTKRVLDRLQGEFSGRIILESIFWEHEPLLATASFQKQIVRPSETDIMVTILWSRLGTRLPSQFKRADGSHYSSGTEFEFEDAVTSYRLEGKPDLLVYRKTADPVVSLKDKNTLLEKLNQKEALDAFFDKWFHDRSEGTLIAAFHPFENSANFEELLELHLKKLIERRLPKEEPGEEITAGPVQWQKGSPYRGLHVFNFEHAPIFFGRTKAVGDVLNALRLQSSEGRAFVLVLGMSGGGKSSLIQAGVLPVLTQPGVIEGTGLWRRAVMRPGDSSVDVFDSLAAAFLRKEALSELAHDNIQANELAQLLRETPRAVMPLLKGGLSRAASEFAKKEQLEEKPSAKLVLVVDQMEEMFTLDRVTDADRMAFIEALDTLARSGWVWIIAALRSDFYPRCSEYEKLVALKDGAGQYDLLPPTPAEIGQMIRQPAQAAGLHFGEDSTTKERLDETLRDAASKDPGCLALLEFTLEELYKNRTEKGFLTQEAYKGLRGVEGALAQRAEAVYDGLEVDVKSAFGPIFHELVSIGLGEEDIITRKYAPLDLISSDTKSKKFVEAFIESRLFVSDLDDKDNAVVSVAHEALLQHWPRLQEWVEKNKEDLRAHARVSAAASRWMEEGKSKDYLLTAGKPLAEAEELTKISSLDLREEERSFIATSIAKKRRIKWLKRGVVVAMALLTVIAVSMAYIANKQQQRAQIEAQTSNQVSEFLVNLFEVSDPSEARGNSITAREVLDKGVAKVEEELKDQPEIQARLMTTMGMVYQSLGLYEAASPMLENALSIRKELHGEEHPMVCISINNLAGLMKDKGEYDQSETLLREALDTHKKLKGDQREYTEILNTLALLLLDRGRYEEAEPLFRELLSINRKIRDEKDPIIASSLNNLGLALHYKGEYEEAEQYYREAIRIIRGVSGDFNPQLAQDLGNLALLLMDKGDLAGAEPLFREALAIEKKVYSEPHPEIAITLNNLAAMLQTTGEYKEAENLYEESLNIAREVWKNGHPSIASTLTSLAVLLAKQQEYDKAEPLFRDALAMHKKLLGDEHPSVAFSLSNLAVLLGKKQEYDKAEPLFREALQMRRKLLGNEHVDIAVSLNNLARLYLEQHEYGKAEPLFREALSMFRKLVGDSHPTIASILINMATLQFKQGNYHDAEPLYRECYDTRKKTLPEGHPLTISGKRELGNCLAKLERFEEAEKLLLECCENLESQSEPNASEIKKTLGYIVDLYTMWNKPKKAGEYRTKLKGLSEQ